MVIYVTKDEINRVKEIVAYGSQHDESFDKDDEVVDISNHSEIEMDGQMFKKAW